MDDIIETGANLRSPPFCHVNSFAYRLIYQTLRTSADRLCKRGSAWTMTSFSTENSFHHLMNTIYRRRVVK